MQATKKVLRGGPGRRQAVPSCMQSASRVLHSASAKTQHPFFVICNKTRIVCACVYAEMRSEEECKRKWKGRIINWGNNENKLIFWIKESVEGCGSGAMIQIRNGRKLTTIYFVYVWCVASFPPSSRKSHHSTDGKQCRLRPTGTTHRAHCSYTPVHTLLRSSLRPHKSPQTPLGPPCGYTFL